MGPACLPTPTLPTGHCLPTKTLPEEGMLQSPWRPRAQPGDTLTLPSPKWLSLLLLLLLPGPLPMAGMEDAAFPHLGESSQPPPRACPLRCSCPRVDTVDCDGLDLRVFPDNITRAAQHLSLQVGPREGSGGTQG